MKRVSLFIAWLIATLAWFGSLYKSRILGFTPCSFCQIERYALFPIAVLISYVILTGTKRRATLLLPLPLFGVVVSSLHVFSYYRECPSCSFYKESPLYVLAIFILILLFSALGTTHYRKNAVSSST